MASMYTASLQIRPPHMRFVSENVSIMMYTTFRWMDVHKHKVDSGVRPCLFFRNWLCLWFGVHLLLL